MTGNEIRGVRQRLGLSRSVFAGLLGVVPDTLGRWESRQVDVAMEPFQWKLLLRLQDYQRRHSPEEIASLGERLVADIALQGSLYGLYVLLGVLLDLPAG